MMPKRKEGVMHLHRATHTLPSVTEMRNKMMGVMILP